MSLRPWIIRLHDILHAAQKTVSHTRDLDYEQFCLDEWQVDAALHNFILIGEASRNVPDEIKDQYPQVAWEEMRDMRNFVIHEYFGVDLSIVWQTIQEDFPLLIQQIEKILKETNP